MYVPMYLCIPMYVHTIPVGILENGKGRKRGARPPTLLGGRSYETENVCMYHQYGVATNLIRTFHRRLLFRAWYTIFVSIDVEKMIQWSKKWCFHMIRGMVPSSYGFGGERDHRFITDAAASQLLFQNHGQIIKTALLPRRHHHHCHLHLSP